MAFMSEVDAARLRSGTFDLIDNRLPRDRDTPRGLPARNGRPIQSASDTPDGSRNLGDLEARQATRSTAALQGIYDGIVADPGNDDATRAGLWPIYTAHPAARILIIGQAPGSRAQNSGIPWDDPSGATLRRWLGVTDEQFYNPELFALLPMDFYYPGKGAHGDLPPRPGFAQQWHPRLLAELPLLQFTVLIGRYAHRRYLTGVDTNVTETVRAFRDHLPGRMPLVHPSPLNFRWQSRNPWFLEEAVPALQTRVRMVLG
jgi:uracil-DNA glycosylase